MRDQTLTGSPNSLVVVVSTCHADTNPRWRLAWPPRRWNKRVSLRDSLFVNEASPRSLMHSTRTPNSTNVDCAFLLLFRFIIILPYFLHLDNCLLDFRLLPRSPDRQPQFVASRCGSLAAWHDGPWQRVQRSRSALPSRAPNDAQKVDVRAIETKTLMFEWLSDENGCRILSIPLFVPDHMESLSQATKSWRLGPKRHKKYFTATLAKLFKDLREG